MIVKISIFEMRIDLCSESRPRKSRSVLGPQLLPGLMHNVFQSSNRHKAQRGEWLLSDRAQTLPEAHTPLTGQGGGQVPRPWKHRVIRRFAANSQSSHGRLFASFGST